MPNPWVGDWGLIGRDAVTRPHTSSSTNENATAVATGAAQGSRETRSATTAVPTGTSTAMSAGMNRMRTASGEAPESPATWAIQL